MAQFDLYTLPDGTLVCDLQTDLLDIPETRLVAPLRDVGRFTSFPGLTPVVTLDGRRWVVRIPELGAVRKSLLSGPIGTLAPQRDALKRALDMLIDGV